jgi:hypothetical protein
MTKFRIQNARYSNEKKNPNISQLHILHTYLPMKMEQTECSETSAYKIQTPGNYPEESIQHSEHGESLKSRKPKLVTEYVKCFLKLDDQFSYN